MESFYELAFPEVNFDLEKDTKVCCPFPHDDGNGGVYFEENPSLSINVDKGIHQCFSCGNKGNELSFISEYMGIPYNNATKLKEILNGAKEDEGDWARHHKSFKDNEHIVDMTKQSYMFNDKAIKELQLGVETSGKGISFPVFIFGKLVDVISYNPSKTPKYKKRKGSPNGMIMPYDTWRSRKKKRTIIVAGQKDLGIALSYNFNAIAITGGEGTTPDLFLNDFKNRNVSIIYDNDTAGKQGAVKVATKIKPFVKELNIIDLSETCEEKGEDLWDYFVKYKKSRNDLVELIKSTPAFSEEDYQQEVEKQIPTISLEEATSSKYQNSLVKSNIQVIGSDAESYMMDTAITGISEENETRYWAYTHEKAEQMFYLVGSSLKAEQIYKHQKMMLGFKKDENPRIRITERKPIYKANVSNLVEASNIEDKITEYEVFSIGNKLESGKRYKITYKLVPHPLQGKANMLVVFDVEDSQDSITNFQINDESKENLKIFQSDGDLTKTIDKHIQKVKGLVHADYRDLLLLLVDLWYHTPLKFNIGNQKNIRAYLDMLIVTESRVGKSTTVQALQQTYDLGTRIPLNGSNATTAGIIGGSHKTKNGFQVRAGAIPRAHKGAVIFEELMKAKQDILSELTEVRSSHQVMITRVSGTIQLPAFVRQLTLTNPRIDEGGPKPIATYPNGIEILTDLVGTPEDIARYDVVAVLGQKGVSQIDPFFVPEDPYPEEAYKDRIRWVWSRRPDQVIISKDTYTHVVDTANKLNQTFDSYIKLFSTEAWIKILRLATAIASYVVSTDDSFEHIIVKKEHVDYAAELLISLYDNNTFRFREYVEQEREYTDLKEGDIDALQKIWNDNQTVLLHLENHSKIPQRVLMNISGLDNQGFSRVLNQLTTRSFIKITQNDIVPVVKFRKAMKKIDKTKSPSTITI